MNTEDVLELFALAGQNFADLDKINNFSLLKKGICENKLYRNKFMFWYHLN